MKKLALFSFGALQLFTATGIAAPTYTMKAESSATETETPNGVVYTVVNTNFAFTNLYSPKKNDYTDGLIAQRIENKSGGGIDGTSTKFEAVAWIGGKNPYDTKLWTISDCADSGWQSGNFYWTTEFGANDSDSLQRAYSARTGKYVFSTSTEPASVEINIPKDTINRYFSYVSRNAAVSECKKQEMPRNAIGTLIFSDNENQIDRLVLESDDDKLARSSTISLVNEKTPQGTSELSIWGPAEFSSKSEVVKGFSVKVHFGDGSEAVIPVDKDKFDTQKASLPKSVSIRRVSTE